MAAGRVEISAVGMEDLTKVRIALAKNAGCLQNGSHMLLLT